jgi:hypothetical protein
LFLDASVTYRIPTLGVSTFVLGIVFRKRMKRSMRGIKSDIEVEGFLRLAGFTEKINGKVDVSNCGVKGLVIKNSRDVPRRAIQTERVVTFEEITGAAGSRRRCHLPVIAVK